MWQTGMPKRSDPGQVVLRNNGEVIPNPIVPNFEGDCRIAGVFPGLGCFTVTAPFLAFPCCPT